MSFLGLAFEDVWQ